MLLLLLVLLCCLLSVLLQELLGALGVLLLRLPARRPHSFSICQQLQSLEEGRRR